MFRKLLLSCLLATIYLSANAAYIPVTLTGFNTDAICNNAGAPNTSTTNLGVTSASPSGFDAQGYWLTDSTFNPGSGTTTTPAMPTNLLLTSQLDPNVKWQLMPYTGNNVLRIVNVANDSLVFQTAQSAGELYILYSNVTTVTGGSVDITVNFTDGTTQVSSANATPNWFNNIAVSGITSAVYMIGGRYNGNSGGGFQNTGTGSPAGPQLYQFKLAIAPANYSKTIRSVKFSNLTTGNLFNVFGITIGTICSGAVTAGTVTSSGGSSVCPSVAFNLSLSGATSGVGITYQWQSSTTGGAPWTNLGTAVTQSATQTVATTYRAYIRCNSGTADTSAPVTITMRTANQCYCIPLATSNTYYLANFTTTGATLNVNNTSGAGITSVGYSDYSGTQTVSAAPSVTVNFSATGSSTHTFVWRIYVDWNQNGLFDPAEQMYTNGTTYANSVTGSFVVPPTATPGLTRMRVFADYYSSTGAPCTFSTTGPYGEAEDYAFNVISSCSPVTGLSASGITSTSATLNWTAVSGAAGYEYVLDQTAANPPGAGTATTAVTYSAGSLLPFTVYYMHVRTNCGTTFSSWITISFTTSCANPLAVVTVNGPTSVCAPDSIKLHANRATGISYQWKKGGVDIIGATDSTYFATTSGNYTVVTSISTCNTTSAITAININPKPDTTVTMVPANGIICSGNTAALSAVASTGAAYQWYLNGAAISGATTSSYTASAAGNYRVLIINATSCADTSGIHTVTVNTTPSINVTPATATTICNGSNVSLTAGGATTYSWSPATGLSATTGATVIANPTTTTTYTITGDNGTGCTGTTTKTVTVNPLPSIDITPATAVAVCAGSSATLTANGGVSYNWSPATGLSATTGATVTATPAATITYTVTGTGANGCTNTATKTVTVNAVPTLNILPAGATGICTGGSIALTATGATTYSWSPSGSLSAATGATVTATPAATTTYTIVGTTAAGCQASTIKTVTVSAPPTLAILPSTATVICSGSSVSLTATGATTYSWSPATGLSSTTTATTTASPTTTITYTVTGTTSGCSVTDTKTVTVNPLPTAVITAAGATGLCQGNTVVLTASTGTGYTYVWRTNGIANGVTAPTFTATTSGTYDVIISDGSCTSTSNAIPVTISNAPPVTVTASGPTTFCQGANVILNAVSNPAYTYQWQQNSIDIPGATAASYVATSAGDYRVVVTNVSCTVTSGITTVSVNGNPPAAITAQGSTTFCLGGAVTLEANAGFTYQWMRNNNNIAGATSVTYVATTSGNYSAIVTNPSGCTTPSAAIAVNVVTAPLPDITVIYNTTLITGAYLSYQWYLNGVAIPGATNRDYIATQSGTYTVEVTIVAGCTKTSLPVVIRGLDVTAVGGTNVSFYPNPAATTVTIVADKAVNVSLSGLDGREILRKDNAKTLDIAALADGVYMMRITDKQGQLLKVERLIKTTR